jgi:hypothetical protein
MNKPRILICLADFVHDFPLGEPGRAVKLNVGEPIAEDDRDRVRGSQDLVSVLQRGGILPGIDGRAAIENLPPVETRSTPIVGRTRPMMAMSSWASGLSRQSPYFPFRPGRSSPGRSLCGRSPAGRSKRCYAGPANFLGGSATQKKCGMHLTLWRQISRQICYVIDLLPR